MIQKYNQVANEIKQTKNRKINCFQTNIVDGNIDTSVVESFGEEWIKFNQFNDEDIRRTGDMYFDIITDKMVNKHTYGLDVGCGTGRWTKFLLEKIGFMEAIDPSKAIFAADTLLKGYENVRLSVASTDNIPFADNTFDFVMSIGVLHHIPNTPKAMADCVRKLKIGGYFYTYLYYSLDNKGFLFKLLFTMATGIRKVVSNLPVTVKKIVCDIIAILFYMPFVLLGRFLNIIGLKRLAMHLPLNAYQKQSFFIIRNDALDRFGTSLEQRFSKEQIRKMMADAGLEDIIIPDTLPYWHAVGKRVQ